VLNIAFSSINSLLKIWSTALVSFPLTLSFSLEMKWEIFLH
jgi:hypothetical protein